MYTLSALTIFLFAITPSFAIPPPDFGFPEAPNDTALTVTYQDNGKAVVVTEAELFGVHVPSQVPTVAVNPAGFQSIADYDGSYTLLMVDPDARYPQNPTSRFILHWLQTDLTTGPQAADGTTQFVNTTAPQAAYRAPSPPSNSSAHRYILYAFFQPPNFTFPAAFDGYGATNRSNFNLTAFLAQANLGPRPAAAMYFYASNETSVPQDFIAAAGATYPGGNGDMITAGPGPSITPSTSAPAASASATGSAASSSPYGGGAVKAGVGMGIFMSIGAMVFWNTM